MTGLPPASSPETVKNRASLTSRVPALPSSPLPARPAVSLARTGTPVPSTSTYSMSGTGSGGGSGTILRSRIAAASCPAAFRAGQRGHLGQARRQRPAGQQAELPVAGSEPAPAGRAVIPGPLQCCRAEDRGDRLGPAARVTGLPGAADALGMRAGVAVVLLIQHGLQQRRPRRGERGAHRILQHAQHRAGAEHARRDPGEPAYLGGGGLLEPRREPPL